MNGMNRYIEAEFRDRLSAAKERAEKAEAQVQAVRDVIHVADDLWDADLVRSILRALDGGDA